MKREFKVEGDVMECLNIVKREDGVRKSKDLAREYVERGLACLEKYKGGVFEGDEDEWKEVVDLIEYILNREK